MPIQKSLLNPSDALLVLTAIALAYLGFVSGPLYFAGSIACLSIVMLRRPLHKRLGITVFVFSAIYFLVVFGYGVGKDMAARDSARDDSQSSAPRR